MTRLPEYGPCNARAGRWNDLPNSVQGIEVDVVNGKVYVYASVRRVGVEILEFDAGAVNKADRFKRVGRLQTPDNPFGPSIGTNGAGVKTLMVSDYRSGFRMYKD